jgi:hypothetical protein
MSHKDEPLILRGAGGRPKQQTRTNTNDNIFSRDKVELVLALGEGPIEGLAKPDGMDPLITGDDFRNFFVGDVPLRRADNTDNFDDLGARFYPGSGLGETVELTYGGQANQVDVGVNIQKANPVKRLTPPELRGRIRKIDVRIVITQLYIENDSGTYEHTAEFSIHYKKARASDVTFINLTSGPYYDAISTHMKRTGKTTSGWAYDYEITLPALDPDPTDDWEIKVTKYNDDYDPTVTPTKTLAELAFDSFQCITTPNIVHSNLAMVRVRGRSTDQFTSVPDFYGIYNGLIVQVPENYDPNIIGLGAFDPVEWNGAFKPSWTNNPAWILYDLIMNPRYGLKAHSPSVTVNAAEFYQAGLYCNDDVETPSGAAKRYTFNGILKENQSAMEVLQYIASSFDAVIVDDGNGTIGLKLDVWEEPFQLVTPECITAEGFQYSYSSITDRPNDYTVSFVNPDIGWEEDRRNMVDETLILRNGRIPTDIVAVGCTNELEAVRRSLRRMISVNTETTTVSFNLPRQGLAFEPFEIMYLADPSMLWGMYTGRIMTWEEFQITLRDPLDLEVGVWHDFWLMTYGGVSKFKVFAGQRPTQFLQSDIEADPLRAENAQFAVVAAEYQPKPFRILSLEESSDSPDLYKVSALEVNKAKYDMDLSIVGQTFTIRYSYDQSNLNLFNEFFSRHGIPKVGQTIIFEFSGDCLIYSADTARPALETGTGWPAGVIPLVEFKDTARVAGCGGAGGAGGGFHPVLTDAAMMQGKNGGTGGVGVLLQSPCRMKFSYAPNRFTRWAGGGGGGGGSGSALAVSFEFGGVAATGSGGGGGSPYGAAGPSGPTGGQVGSPGIPLLLGGNGVAGSREQGERGGAAVSQFGPPVNGHTLYSVHVGRGGRGGGGGGLSTETPFFNAQSPGGGADPTTAGLYPGSLGYAYQVGGPPGLGGKPGVVVVGAENWITEPGSANTQGGITPMLPAGSTRSLPSTPPTSADDYWNLTTSVPIDGLTQT